MRTESKIIEGLRDAVAYTQGDRSRGQTYMTQVVSMARRDGTLPSPRRLLHLAHLRAEAVWASSIGTDITPRMFDVLNTLAEHGPLSPTAISQLTGIDRSTLVELIKRMTRQRLVSRFKHRVDKRIHMAQLTAAGADKWRRIAPMAAKIDGYLEHALSPRDNHTMLLALDRILKQPCP